MRTSRSLMCGTAAAASSRSTVVRQSSEPARASAATCLAVLSTSAVSVLVIDCTTTGACPPTITSPTRTATDWRRAWVVAASAMQKLLASRVPEASGSVKCAARRLVPYRHSPGAIHDHQAARHQRDGGQERWRERLIQHQMPHLYAEQWRQK